MHPHPRLPRTSHESNQTCLSGSPGIILSEKELCIDGFYCPNNSAEHPPEYCPPTLECQLLRLQESHNICDSQGEYEPSICKAGFYCPSGGAAQLQCPKGNYCPLGTVSPFKCAPLSVCPEGSVKQVPILPFLCIGILDVLLLSIWLSAHFRGSLKRKLSKFVPLFRTTKTQEPEPETAGSRSRGLSLISNGGDHPSGCLFPSFMEQARPQEVEIQFRDISMCAGRDKRQILRHQDGDICAGSFLGVMGPSGSGKTTLLNILAGRIKPTTGSIYVNGELTQSADLKSLVGFVPQDDIVLPDLTVRENILHSARIRIGSKLNDQEIQQFVDSLITNLGLSKVRDSLVGDVEHRGVSGGERKRVNVALELAAAPSVLFLDEPTSGLDATTALSLVELLKSLSQQGVTIVCVVHQPRKEIFTALNDLILLEAGSQIFFGQAQDAMHRLKGTKQDDFGVCNPADVILDIISGVDSFSLKSGLENDSSETLRKSINCVHGTNSEGNLNMMLRSAKNQTAPWHRQVYLNFLRGIRQQSRQYTSFFLEIMSGAAIGLLIGFSNYEFHGHLFQGPYLSPFEPLSSSMSYRLVSEQGMLCVLAIATAAGPAGVRTFGDEKSTFNREADSGHSKSAYFLGKIMCTIPRIMLSSMHFTAFYMVLTTPIISFQTLYGLNFLYFYCIYGMSCIVSSVTPPQNGPLMAMLASLVMCAMVGCGPRLHTVIGWNLEWLWYMWPGVWYTEAIFTGNISPLSHIYNTQIAAEITGFTIDRIGFDAGLLLLIGTVWHFASTVLLAFFAHRRGK